MSPQCTATTRRKTPCQAPALPGTDPPRCAAHGGRPVGVPSGNQNARKHRFYAADPAAVTIDDAIAGLIDKMARLDEMIANLEGNGDTLIRLFALYTQASSRLSRLLRDKRALSGRAADGIAGAIAQALDELSTELRTEL